MYDIKQASPLTDFNINFVDINDMNHICLFKPNIDIS